MKNNIKININMIATLFTLFSFVVGGTIYFQKILDRIDNAIEYKNEDIYSNGEFAVDNFYPFYNPDVDPDFTELKNKIENEKVYGLYELLLSKACKNEAVKNKMMDNYDHQLIKDLCNLVK